jgi:hypothetical protein
MEEKERLILLVIAKEIHEISRKIDELKEDRNELLEKFADIQFSTPLLTIVK